MALVGGGGSVRVRRTEEGEGVRGREREQRGRKRGEGTRGVRGRLGNDSVEAGGGRGGIGARHRAASCAGTGRRQEKGGQVGWAAGGAGPGKWRQVGGPGGLLSLSIYFCSVLFFLFSCH